MSYVSSYSVAGKREGGSTTDIVAGLNGNASSTGGSHSSRNATLAPDPSMCIGVSPKMCCKKFYRSIHSVRCHITLI